MSQDQFDSMKERILEKYKRMGVEDKFLFVCDKNVPCFTKCCGDVNIFLTPYDVMRLKNSLGVTSGEFLKKYTVSPFTKDQQLPNLLLKMNDEDEKRCFFVSEEGCSVYDSRPWPCRMYPIGLAQAEGADGKTGEEFYFMMAEDKCDGLGKGKEWTVKEWTTDQGVDDYNLYGDMYRKLTLHPFFQKGNSLPPEKMDMFFMALYDLDTFRRFIFNSKFLERFEVEQDLQERLKTRDSELLTFAFRWLHFALFGEDTIRIKQDVLQEFEKKMASEKKEK